MHQTKQARQGRLDVGITQHPYPVVRLPYRPSQAIHAEEPPMRSALAAHPARGRGRPDGHDRGTLLCYVRRAYHTGRPTARTRCDREWGQSLYRFFLLTRHSGPSDVPGVRPCDHDRVRRSRAYTSHHLIEKVSVAERACPYGTSADLLL